MEDIKNTIGRNIRTLRKHKGQTLQSLSKQVGITYQQLSRIEKGLGTSTSTLERIATILGVDIKILMEEPETTLKNFIPQTRSFVPDQMCNELYAKLFTDIIKPVNDITIQKFIYEVLDKLVRDKEKIRNLMCAHVGSKSNYQFTKTELEDFCQHLFFDFADHALRLSKTDYDEEEQTEENDTYYE